MGSLVGDGTLLLLVFSLSLPSLPSFSASFSSANVVPLFAHAQVALGGLLPNTLVYSKVIKTWQKPLHNTHWELPTRKEIDWKLVFGSVMFGVGWGESLSLSLRLSRREEEEEEIADDEREQVCKGFVRDRC